jgi:membrane protein implicated in regulation of membrane protease activity
MNDESAGAERGPADFFLFALAFACFMTAAAGIVVGLPWLSFCGTLVLLFVVLTFWVKSSFA